jgi:hypothetical protein
MIKGDDFDSKLWNTYNLLKSNNMYRDMAQVQRFASATVLSLLYEFLDDEDTSDEEFRAYMRFAKKWFRKNEEQLKQGV